MVPISRRRAAKDALFEGFAVIASALASGRRVEIVELLAQGERTVEGVSREIGQSLANTSHHLRTLARAGLVATRRKGTHVHYRLASEEVVAAWLSLRGLAAGHLDSIGELAQAYLGDRDSIDLINRGELADRMRSGEVVLIDVRPPSEFAAGHLPGAWSVPPDDVDALDELMASVPAGADIVAYCRGPYCVFADEAVALLRRHVGAAVTYRWDG